MKNDTLARRDEPWSLAEQIVAGLAARDGDTIACIASRLRRSVRQVRAVVFGDAA